MEEELFVSFENFIHKMRLPEASEVTRRRTFNKWSSEITTAHVWNINNHPTWLLYSIVLHAVTFYAAES